MRAVVEFVTHDSQTRFLLWLSCALDNSPALAVESVTFPDTNEHNIGAYGEGLEVKQ